MTSNDRDILIDIQSRLGRIELRLDGAEKQLAGLNTRVSALEQNYQIMHEDIRVHNSRLEMSIWFTGVCFAVLALVIAFVGMLAPKFWEHYARRESKPDSQFSMDDIIREVGKVYSLTPKR